MAADYPQDLSYMDTHEYIRLEGDVATIGISAFAIQQLGDIVFLELADVGKSLEKGETFGSIESVKVAEDLYTPVSGIVLAQNTAIVELIEQSQVPDPMLNDPYGAGWLIKIQLEGSPDLADAMSAEVYRSKVEGLGG